MNKAIDAIAKIQQSAISMQEIRVITDMKIGEVARQGDIYVERVSKIENKGEKLPYKQLAPGTSKGSRHIVEDGNHVSVWRSNPKLIGKFLFQVGPAIEAERDFCITHPEHAWLKFIVEPEKQYFQVFFQADLLRMKRAED